LSNWPVRLCWRNPCALAHSLGCAPVLTRVASHHARHSWEAHLWQNARQVYLGGFDAEEQAALACAPPQRLPHACQATHPFNAITHKHARHPPSQMTSPPSSAGAGCVDERVPQAGGWMVFAACNMCALTQIVTHSVGARRRRR
jgi:hypothetical protein